MACKQWREEWVAHLYDEIDGSERTAVEGHLALCASCSETMRELGESRRLLGEFAPSVPAVPRVVVLGPRPVWSNAWAFAAGLAAAALVFFVGTMSASRGAQTRPGTGDVAGRAAAGPVSSSRVPDDSLTEVSAVVQGLDGRVKALEEAPQPIRADYASEEVVTHDQFDREMDQVSRRLRRERTEDLDYLLRWLAASEQRTGTFMDRTQEALTYLALRGDPRVRER